MHPGTAALERGLLALQTLAEPDVGPAGLTVNELAERIGSDKSQTSRTLATLAVHGWVVRDDTSGAFRRGPMPFSIASRTLEARLLALSAPHLRALARDLGETVHLSVRQPSGVLTLASETPVDANLLAPSRIGTVTPLATTSAGRILAADLGDDELEALAFSPNARAAVAEARSRGIAIVRDEFEAGLTAAAAPIVDPTGRIVAAINVSGPTFRLEERIDSAAAAVANAAAAVSDAIATTPAEAVR